MARPLQFRGIARFTPCLLALAGLGFGCAAAAPSSKTSPWAPPPTTAPPPPEPASPPPAAAERPAEGPREVFPGITLDPANRYVEVDATVVGREVEWLELLACRPNTREYESIVSIDGESASLGVALSLLGLEAGQPARAEEDENGGLRFLAPHGPTLGLFFVLEDRPDAPVPANEWVVNQQTGQIMPGNTWLFTGSTVIDYRGQSFFMAEKNGTVVSLLNFGDELISRPTDRSEDGGTDLWTANTDAIPPVGTRVKLRFRPAE